MTTLHDDILVADIAPEVAAYHRDLAAASDKLQAKYRLDDMSQATPAMLDELEQLVAKVNLDHGVHKA